MIDILAYVPNSFAGIALILLFFISFVVLQLYTWNVYGRVALSKNRVPVSTATENPQEGVSIIICARNEREAIGRNLSKFLEQDYPEFEVILVNDCSEDESDELLGEFKSKYPQLEVRNIVKDEIFKHGKPMALGVGIKAAKYEWLLFCDIDCIPIDEHWLSSMQKNFTPSAEVVTGYTSYPKVKMLYRASLFFSSIHYMGFALMKRPYMANGKNYAYTRSSFFDRKGFDIRMAVERENIVFIGSIANSKNTVVDLSVAASTICNTTITARYWKQQKASERTSHHFPGSKKRNPDLLSKLAMFVFLVASITLAAHSSVLFMVVAGGWLLHVATITIVLSKICNRLNEKKVLLYFLFYSIVRPFFGIAYLFQGRQSENYRF